MARTLGVLTLALVLTACSSGVSETGAGGQGTDCTAIELRCFAVLNPDSFSIDVFGDVTEGEDGMAVQPTVLPATDFTEITITVIDPLGQFSRVLQGIQFDNYVVSYAAAAAPTLGSRTFSFTETLLLDDNGRGTVSVTIPVADQVTKSQFRAQASGSTVFTYKLTVIARGRDFVNNANVQIVATANVEIGNFVDSGSN